MRDTWFEALQRAFDRAPGPRIAAAVAITAVLTALLHLAEWLDEPEALRFHFDLLVGAGALPLFVWVGLELDDVARRALVRLRSVLDPDGASEADIAADLVRTPGSLALATLVIGVIAGFASVVQSPENWSIDLARPGARLAAAFVISVATDVILLGLLAHILHQLRVVARVHREAVRVDLYHLEPLYAFSTLTAWAGIGLIAMTVALIAGLSLSIGKFLLTGAADLALTGSIFVVATAAFVVPLVGLHGRIAEEKSARMADARVTLATLAAEFRKRVASGDLEGAGRLKDALLAADANVATLAGISTWPWRTGTLRAFISAVVLPIGLFLVYETLRRALG